VHVGALDASGIEDERQCRKSASPPECRLPSARNARKPAQSCFFRKGNAYAFPERGIRLTVKAVARWLSIAAGASAAAYAAYVGVAWIRYGHASHSPFDAADPLLDRFMGAYDVAERHHVRVRAPAQTTFEAACHVDLLQSPVVRAIIRTREVILGSASDPSQRPHGLLAATKSFGWGVLAEVPGREVVMGAVTQPWEADVVFRGLPPDEFAAFDEPGYVKIAWTLRADPTSPVESVFRSETRAVATDASARAKFRWYWSFLSPGIIVIRRVMLWPVKAAAERRFLSARRGISASALS
jgi:hypothetical protein